MRKEEILRSLSLPQNDGISHDYVKDYASAPLCVYASGDLRAKAEAVCDMFKLFAGQRSRRGSRLMRGGQDKTACPLTFLPSKKAAFTLAEVLITLGVVGIVAALTIPNMVANYKKRTYVIGLQKAYSQTMQAFRMISAEYGSLADIGWGKSTEAIDGVSFANANVRNIYLLHRQFKDSVWLEPNSEKCLYDKYYTSVDNSLPNANGNLCTSGGFITQDGVLYAGNGANLYIDINGIKGNPNHIGRDIFLFYIDSTKARIYGRAGWNNGTGYCMTNKSKSYAVWGSYCTQRVLDEKAMNY